MRARVRAAAAWLRPLQVQSRCLVEHVCQSACVCPGLLRSPPADRPGHPTAPTTFECIERRLGRPQLEGHRGEQAVARLHRARPRVEQHEAAGTVGVLGLARGAPLACSRITCTRMRTHTGTHASVSSSRGRSATSCACCLLSTQARTHTCMQPCTRARVPHPHTCMHAHKRRTPRTTHTQAQMQCIHRPATTLAHLPTHLHAHHTHPTHSPSTAAIWSPRQPAMGTPAIGPDATRPYSCDPANRQHGAAEHSTAQHATARHGTVAFTRRGTRRDAAAGGGRE